ncbi:MAG: UDP-N-acetylglucosamine:LPS N-acetylglucosamine transferase [Pseudohongiellaceae bacterium]|jgi:UDP-N-acetylglucosamine:LPS N-acetylglucosamine transferase
MKTSQKRVLAVASGGGHWVQLMRLRPALTGCRCAFVSVDEGSRAAVAPDRFYRVVDGNRSTKLKLVFVVIKLLYIVLAFRPDVIVSTGAAHGYLAIRLGKLVGAKGLFIDSIANAEKLSLSGELAVDHSDLVLTQWPDLSDEQRIYYRGAVL